MATAIPLVSYHFDCGEPDWRVRSVVLEERLGQPFFAELRLVLAGAATTSDLLDRPAVLSLVRGDAVRTFHGEVIRAEVYATTGGGTHARIGFAPVLARAGRCRRHRIFQDVGIVDLVREVLAASAAFDLVDDLDRARPPRDYCVQYDESDLDFASRLLEDEGIAWFLDCGLERPVMHLVEGAHGYPVIPGAEPEVPWIPDQFEVAEVESIQAMTLVRRSASPGVVQRDWQWLGDEVGVREEHHPTEAPQPWSEHAHPRRWAGDATKESAQIEYERRATRDLLAQGTANVIGFAPGLHFTFDLGGSAPEPLLLTGVMHRGDCPEVELGDGRHGSGPNYTNAFECQPLAVPYRPQRTVPRPRIHGMHTAVVTGPSGEEIFTDEHGRIRVRMHWDRSGSAPELSSCWMRVAQTWGGAGWGTMFIPRVGMEVLVTFIDGDPDRPMCIGCVYNGAHRPPYPLPDERTKSTIRTQSSPGGDGHNELTFEDAAGKEEVYVHAQRNLREVVRANHSERVGVDDTAHIGRDRKTTIDRDEVHDVGGDRTRTVAGGEMVTVQGCQQIEVLGVPGAGAAMTAVPGAGMKVTGTYVVEVSQQIELRCGASTIVMSPAGIALNSPMVTINGGGSAFSLLPGTATLASAAVGIAADGAEVQLSDTMRLSSPKGTILADASGGSLKIDHRTRLRAPKILMDGADNVEFHSDARVAIAAPTIELLADETLAATCTAALELQGASISSTATGQHTIKGARIDLNPPGGA